MEQVILTGPGHLASRHVAETNVAENEALVRMNGSGYAALIFTLFLGNIPLTYILEFLVMNVPARWLLSGK